MRPSILLLSCLAIAPLHAATTVTFKQGSDVVSSDGLINLTNYQGNQDTSMVQESGNNNYGGRPTLLAGVLGAGQVRTSLLRYDLTSLAGQYSSIDSMKLRLYVSATSAAGSSMGMNVSLEREGNAGWVEGSANGAVEAGAATWNHEQNTTGAWLGGSNGARGATDLYGVLGTTTLNTTIAGAGTWIEIDLLAAALPSNVDTLTEVIDLWTSNGGANNAGVLLSYTNNVSNPQWQFASSESTTATFRPELVITYTSAPEPSAAVLSGLGALALLRRRRK